MKIGNLVRFNHERDGGPVHRVVSVMKDGMIEIHDMGGYFAPHLFVIADDVAAIPPDIKTAAPACKYGDPTCPCQDGDECHYEGPNPINVPPEYVRRALASRRAACDTDLERYEKDIVALTERAVNAEVDLKACALERDAAFRERNDAREDAEALKRKLSAISELTDHIDPIEGVGAVLDELEGAQNNLTAMKRSYNDASRRSDDLRKALKAALAALEPFAEVGQWLFARPEVPDDQVIAECLGINGYKILLTRGHFKAAHQVRSGRRQA